MNQSKKPYETAFVEIITFSANDIIQTSSPESSLYPSDTSPLPWDVVQ